MSPRNIEQERESRLSPPPINNSREIGRTDRNQRIQFVGMIDLEFEHSDSVIHPKPENPCHSSLRVCGGPCAPNVQKWQASLINCQAACSCQPCSPILIRCTCTLCRGSSNCMYSCTSLLYIEEFICSTGIAQLLKFVFYKIQGLTFYSRVLELFSTVHKNFVQCWKCSRIYV